MEAESVQDDSGEEMKRRRVVCEVIGEKTALRIYEVRFFGRGECEIPPKLLQYMSGGYLGFIEPDGIHNTRGSESFDAIEGCGKVTPMWKNQRFSHNCLENSFGVSHTFHNPYCYFLK